MPNREPDKEEEPEKEPGESKEENKPPESKSNLAAWLAFAGVIVTAIAAITVAVIKNSGQEKPSRSPSQVGRLEQGVTSTPIPTPTPPPAPTATAPKFSFIEEVVVSGGQNFEFPMKNIQGDKDNFAGSFAGMTGKVHYEIGINSAGKVEVSLVGEARAEEVKKDWSPSGDNSTWYCSFRQTIRDYPAGYQVHAAKPATGVSDEIRVLDDPEPYVKAYENRSDVMSSNGVITRWEFQLRTGKLVVRAGEFRLSVGVPIGN